MNDALRTSDHVGVIGTTSLVFATITISRLYLCLVPYLIFEALARTGISLINEAMCTRSVSLALLNCCPIVKCSAKFMPVQYYATDTLPVPRCSLLSTQTASSDAWEREGFNGQFYCVAFPLAAIPPPGFLVSPRSDEPSLKQKAAVEKKQGVAGIEFLKAAGVPPLLMRLDNQEVISIHETSTTRTQKLIGETGRANQRFIECSQQGPSTIGNRRHWD
ncbi:hypothetical protein AB1N83_002953 [Pleurotus pulmonarius]